MCSNCDAAARFKLSNPDQAPPQELEQSVAKAEQTLSHQAVQRETKMLPTVDYLKINVDIARSGTITTSQVTQLKAWRALLEVDAPLSKIDDACCIAFYDAAFEGVKKFAEVWFFRITEVAGIYFIIFLFQSRVTSWRGGLVLSAECIVVRSSLNFQPLIPPQTEMAKPDADYNLISGKITGLSTLIDLLDKNDEARAAKKRELSTKVMRAKMNVPAGGAAAPVKGGGMAAAPPAVAGKGGVAVSVPKSKASAGREDSVHLKDLT